MSNNKDKLFELNPNTLKYIVVLNQYNYEKLYPKGCCYSSQKKIDKLEKKYNIHIVIREDLNGIYSLNEIINFEKWKKAKLESDIKPKIIFEGTDIEESIIYKKYVLNNTIYYIQLHKYNEVVFEFRRRTYFQVCEALGVKEINYTIFDGEHTNLKAGASATVNTSPLPVKIPDNKDKEDKSNNNGNGIADASVTNDKTNITANVLSTIYERRPCEYITADPDYFEDIIKSAFSLFMINAHDFDNDWNLKHLIRSRLVSNLITNSFTFIMASMDETDINLSLKFNNVLNLGFKFNNHKDKIFCLKMNVTFYKMEEIISPDNVIYDINNSKEKNTKLFNLLISKLNYDIQNNSSISNKSYDEYDHIENFLQNYMSANMKTMPVYKTISKNLELLKKLDNNEYIRIISTISCFHEIEKTLLNQKYLSFNNYLKISDDLKENQHTFDNIIYMYKKYLKDQQDVLSTTTGHNTDSLEYTEVVSYIRRLYIHECKEPPNNFDIILNKLKDFDNYDNFVFFINNNDVEA
jgi:hypothetical protein